MNPLLRLGYQTPKYILLGPKEMSSTQATPAEYRVALDEVWWYRSIMSEGVGST